MAAPHPNSFITDQVLLALTVADIKGHVPPRELPDAIVTVHDFLQVIQIAGLSISNPTVGDSCGVEGALAIINAFKVRSVLIPKGQHRNPRTLVLSMTGDKGGDTVSLIVMSGYGQKITMFSTRPNESWIATEEKRITKAKHGFIWQSNCDSESDEWPAGGA